MWWLAATLASAQPAIEDPRGDDPRGADPRGADPWRAAPLQAPEDHAPVAWDRRSGQAQTVRAANALALVGAAGGVLACTGDPPDPNWVGLLALTGFTGAGVSVSKVKQAGGRVTWLPTLVGAGLVVAGAMAQDAPEEVWIPTLAAGLALPAVQVAFNGRAVARLRRR